MNTICGSYQSCVHKYHTSLKNKNNKINILITGIRNIENHLKLRY